MIKKEQKCNRKSKLPIGTVFELVKTDR